MSRLKLSGEAALLANTISSEEADALASRARAGDKAAQTELLGCMYYMLLGWARKLSAEEQRRSDVARTIAFEAFLDAINKFDPALGVPFFAWAQMKVNYALREDRRKFIERKKLLPKTVVSKILIGLPPEGPDAAIKRQELVRDLGDRWPTRAAIAAVRKSEEPGHHDVVRCDEVDADNPLAFASAHESGNPLALDAGMAVDITHPIDPTDPNDLSRHYELEPEYYWAWGKPGEIPIRSLFVPKKHPSDDDPFPGARCRGCVAALRRGSWVPPSDTFTSGPREGFGYGVVAWTTLRQPARINAEGKKFRKMKKEYVFVQHHPDCSTDQAVAERAEALAMLEESLQILARTQARLRLMTPSEMERTTAAVFPVIQLLGSEPPRMSLEQEIAEARAAVDAREAA